MVKTGFTHCGKYFGSKWSGKRKVSRPRNRCEGVLEFEQGSYAVKTGLLVCEMGAKRLPLWFYTRLRSKTGSKNENYRSSLVTAKNTKNTDEPYCRSVLQGKQDLQGLVSRGGRREIGKAHV